MDTPINPNRIRKALQALKEAERELQAALSDCERPRPDPPPTPVKVWRGHKSLRRRTA
jgi:hypothetical protein